MLVFFCSFDLRVVGKIIIGGGHFGFVIANTVKGRANGRLKALSYGPDSNLHCCSY